MKYCKSFKLLITLILVALLFSIVSAQDDLEDFDPVTMPLTEVRNISSEYVDQDYRLSIALPQSHANSDATYPVLYLLDTAWTFGSATFIQTIDVYPEIIIVGVGYPVDADLEEMRFRDYGTEADSFLQFIDEELIPFINSNYRTEPSENAVVGWSLGGILRYIRCFATRKFLIAI